MNKIIGFYMAPAVLLATASAVSLADESTDLGDISITATREATAKSQSTASSSIIGQQEIERIRPTHPAELMNRKAGVHINVTSGEGHMSAIRQPITTSAVYLFLEDGIPVRSTGFFNHNALYEVNLPQASMVETLKGPGSALYGSDAIGGVINVISKPSPEKMQTELSQEFGTAGWRRTLLSTGRAYENDSYRGDLNVTHNDGWRDNTEYDRQSTSLRWDRFLQNGATLKTLFSSSIIDQAQTGAISRHDYHNRPSANYTPIGFREVTALRLSSAYEHETQKTLTSITPYFRHNVLKLMPTWALRYDPTVFTSKHHSFGLALKHRMNSTEGKSRLIVGADLDYSPGSRNEKSINTTASGNVFTQYSINTQVYLYDVTFKGASPYVHWEASPNTALRINAGLRYDHLSYDYQDRLTTAQTSLHQRPASTAVTFKHWSPKLGASYAFNPGLNGFIAYKHAFRVPSEGQLFRQGRAADTVNLKPVRIDSFELGLRGTALSNLRYEFALYHMSKHDDIVSFRNTIDGSRETLNAGKTRHQGIELGLTTSPIKKATLDINLSYAKHSYEQWSPRTGLDYSGNEIKSAPRLLANTSFAYRSPKLKGGTMELNWEKIGSYWEDDENSHKYAGHDIYHLSVDYPLSRSSSVYGKIKNLSDERYATGASYSQFRGEELTPGQSRSIFFGINYKL